MQIPVKKTINIADGEHEGAVINIRYRSKPYEYVDLEIEFKQGEDKVELKAGYPMVVSKGSQLGALLMRFGTNLEEGDNVDPDKILIGQKIKFKTFTEKNQRGSFARVVVDSVRPSRGMQSGLI
jgi:hypothetical protein